MVAAQIPTYSEGMRLVFNSIADASAVVQDTLAAGIPVRAHISHSDAAYISKSVACSSTE